MSRWLVTALSDANGANIFKVSPNISVWGFIDSVTNNGYSLWPSFENVISIMYVCVYVEMCLLFPYIRLRLGLVNTA